MLAEKAIKPATTEWAALIMFDAKKDSSLRFFVVYGRLKAAMIRDSYRLSAWINVSTAWERWQ